VNHPTENRKQQQIKSKTTTQQHNNTTTHKTTTKYYRSTSMLTTRLLTSLGARRSLVPSSPLTGFFLVQHQRCSFASASSASKTSLSETLFNPTPEHAQLRSMVAEFAKTKVAAQAREFDKNAEMNKELFRELGNLGLLGITIPEKDGGTQLFLHFLLLVVFSIENKC